MTDKNSLMYDTRQLSSTYGGLTDGQEMIKAQHKHIPIHYWPLTSLRIE